MTAFEGGRDEWPLEYQPLAITPPRRRVRRWLRRHRQALLDYTFATLFVLAILAMAALIDGGTLP